MRCVDPIRARRKVEMRFFLVILSVLTAVFITGAVDLMAQAQTSPAFASPSGCRTTTLKNTLLFTQARTGNPNDANIVIGAYTVTDDDPTAIDTGAVENANCNPADVSDSHPTHVTLITVTLAGGDLTAADIRSVKLFLDGNEDGFLQLGQDQQIGVDLPGTCLFSQCVFNFGRSTPLFSVNGKPAELENQDNGDGEPQDEENQEQLDGLRQYQAIIITVDLGPNARAGTNLMINVAAEANDIVTRGEDSVSSDFNDTYRSQTSNIILNSMSGGEGAYVLGINNGSGNPETGMKALQFEGLRTRFRDEKVWPGTREAVAAMIYVCEGGDPVTPQVIVLPAIAKSEPTIAGYPDVLACITSAVPDNIGTRILRLRVGVSGNIGAVGTLRLYDDANDNGVLFEAGEFVLSSNPVNGLAIFGSLNNPLLVSTRSNADPAPGMFSAQTGSNPTLCDSNEANPQPEGTAKGCPHVLVLTFDVNSGAQPGDVHFDVVLDIGNLPGENSDSATASSNLANTSSVKSTVTIDAKETPIVQKSVFKLIAEHSGEANLIENEDIFWAMAQWAQNQPLSGETYVKDGEMLQAVRFWSENLLIAASKMHSSNNNIARVTQPSVLHQRTSTSRLAPGESFWVTTTLDFDRANKGLLFTQALPTGWKITPVKNAGGAFNGQSWLWLTNNGKANVTYKVTVPFDAPAGVYTLNGLVETALSDGAAQTKHFTVTVSGKPVALAVNGITTHKNAFVIEGTGISSANVQLFSLSGVRLSSETSDSQRLTIANWGNLADGVYLYLVTVKGADGRAIRRFSKFIVRH